MKTSIWILTLFFSCVPALVAADLLEQADSLSAARGANFNAATLTVDPTNIRKALDLYKQAFDQLSGVDKEKACWKLMAACYFIGQYAETDSGRKQQVYDIGKKVGSVGLKEFPESVAIHSWMAIIWGVWSEESGILQAAKEGVAGKIREHCEKTIALDDRFQEASGYRVLGRVNFKAPKIPIILGWPSKEKAVEYLEKAYTIAPQNLYTKQYLAEACYEQGQKDRAKTLLREILATQEIIHGVVEDTFIKRDSEKLLKQWK
jgi:tetratricopeptide (TPR) repeat protein